MNMISLPEVPTVAGTACAEVLFWEPRRVFRRRQPMAVEDAQALRWWTYSWACPKGINRWPSNKVEIDAKLITIQIIIIDYDFWGFIMIPPRFITIRMINEGSKMRVFPAFSPGRHRAAASASEGGEKPSAMWQGVSCLKN